MRQKLDFRINNHLEFETLIKSILQTETTTLRS